MSSLFLEILFLLVTFLITFPLKIFIFQSFSSLTRKLLEDTRKLLVTFYFNFNLPSPPAFGYFILFVTC